MPLITNLPSCHNLLKQLGATECKGIRLNKRSTQIVEINIKPFSCEVTSSQTPQHSALRSQSVVFSRITSSTKGPYTDLTSFVYAKDYTNKIWRYVFTYWRKYSEQSCCHTKNSPKNYQTFRVVASKFSEAVKPTLYVPIPATKSAKTAPNSIINTLSLTTPPLAVTAGFLLTQPPFTVHSYTFSAWVILQHLRSWTVIQCFSLEDKLTFKDYR